MWWSGCKQQQSDWSSWFQSLKCPLTSSCVWGLHETTEQTSLSSPGQLHASSRRRSLSPCMYNSCCTLLTWWFESLRSKQVGSVLNMCIKWSSFIWCRFKRQTHPQLELYERFNQKTWSKPAGGADGGEWQQHHLRLLDFKSLSNIQIFLLNITAVGQRRRRPGMLQCLPLVFEFTLLQMHGTLLEYFHFMKRYTFTIFDLREKYSTFLLHCICEWCRRSVSL